MIRNARPADLPAIVGLAVQAVSRDADFSGLRISRPSITDKAEQLIRGNQHFCWVGEDERGVQACVAAETHAGFWFERLQSSVVMFYTRTPGLGLPLLRQYARWVKARPAIKLAVFSLEPNADPRIGNCLKRLGFATYTAGFSYVRGEK